MQFRTKISDIITLRSVTAAFLTIFVFFREQFQITGHVVYTVISLNLSGMVLH